MRIHLFKYWYNHNENGVFRFTDDFLLNECSQESANNCKSKRKEKKSKKSFYLILSQVSTVVYRGKEKCKQTWEKQKQKKQKKHEKSVDDFEDEWTNSEINDPWDLFSISLSLSLFPSSVYPVYKSDPFRFKHQRTSFSTNNNSQNNRL